MKWAGLLVVLAAILPLSNWLKRNPSEAPKIWVLVGFLPFAIIPFHLFMAIISWEYWSGFVKGLEFTVLDAVAIALYLCLPASRNPLPFRISMALYFTAVVVSVFQADVPMAALFYPWQLGRMFLLYAVVARASGDDRVVLALLTGMAIGLTMEAGLAIWERFVKGILQTSGTFGHQNFLGMVSQLVIFPFIALLLAGRFGRWPLIVSLAGAVIAVLTTSRATIGLDVVGCVILFVLSALRRWTSRKAVVALVGATAIGLLAPLAIWSFSERFAKESQIGSTYDERSVLENAARMMLSDHPMGVGANNYVLVANVDGYNSKAHVAWTSGTAFVHNTYLLVAAETGYPGLISFLVLLVSPLFVAFRWGWRTRGDDYRGDLMLGFGVGLLVMYIHCLFEWIFVTASMQYMFAIVVGAVASLYQQVAYRQRSFAYGVPTGAARVSVRSKEGVLGPVTNARHR
jgi:O-antigen ligase